MVLILLMSCAIASMHPELVGNAHVEVSSKGYLERLGDSIAGVVFGIVLVLLAFPLLTFGEGVYVHRLKCLDVAANLLHKGTSGSTENGRQLTHEQGEVHPTNPSLVDPLFGVEVRGVLKLQRRVSMFQHHEEEHSETVKDTVGGGETTTTRYSLRQTWSSSPLALPHFPDKKNPSFPVTQEVVVSESMDMNGIMLSRSQMERIRPSHAFPIDDSVIARIPSSTKSLFPHSLWADQKCIMSRSSRNEDQVGDVRIEFFYAPAQAYSAVCTVENNQFSAFEVTDFGDFQMPWICCSCCMLDACFNALGSNEVDIDLFESGLVPANKMFKRAASTNTLRHAILRLMGFLMFVFGVELIVEPLAVVLDLVGPVGSVARVGLWIIALLIGLCLTMLTVGVAWLWYRPFVACALFIVSTCLCSAVYYAFYYLRSRESSHVM